MYEPKFTYTDRLVGQLIKLEANKTYLQSLDLNYNIKYKLSLNAKALDLFHLAHLLGFEITLKDAEKLASGISPENVDQTNMQVLQNFRNVLEFSRSTMVDSYAEIDFAIILHLNKLILSGWKEVWDSKVRGMTDQIDMKWDVWGDLRDTKLENNTIEEQTANLIQWYKDITPTTTPLIRFGILMYRLLEIYPFVAGNMLSIFAIADYLLLKYSLSSKSYISVVRNFDTNQAKYIEAFNLSKRNVDLSYWLETFVDMLNKDLLEMREGINDYIMEEERAKKQPFLDLNPRQLKVLRYLQNVPYIKREDYCHMMDVSTMTAFRDLNDLLRKKLIKVEGQGRGTKYRLATM